MRYLISPSTLSGSIVIPSSKSQTLRSILFASMAHGKSSIDCYLSSPDTEAMIQACRLFGAKIECYGKGLLIEGVRGKVKGAEDVIQAGNSGIVLRFCGAVAALGTQYIALTGDDSIRHHRPIKPLIEGINQLGAMAMSMREDGYAPLLIKGPIQPGKALIDGEDSQPVSGLLIAAAFASGQTEIGVCRAGEKPWVGLTLDWFDRLGIHYRHQNYEYYWIQGESVIQGFAYTIPGDFSSAAYPIVAALITQSELVLHNIEMRDAQGDKKVISILQQMGAHIEIDEERRRLIVRKGKRLQGMRIDINEMIDAITILAVAGCFAEGKTEIVNGEIARHKECDRIASMVKELRKMGAKVEETPDGMVIEQSVLQGAHCESYKDHRMVMSLAVAALGAKGETMISGTEAAVKTFPHFAESFQRIGAGIREVK